MHRAGPAFRSSAEEEARDPGGCVRLPGPAQSALALTAEGGQPPALLSSGPKVELSSPPPLGMYQTDTDEFQGK